MVRAIITEISGAIEIEAPYNARFVSAIKEIPVIGREWNADRECTDTAHHSCTGRWIIKNTHASMAKAILRNFYDKVEENTLGRGTVIHRWRE